MKDDILTAVKEDPIPTNVAPIAPLPSRLSFCFSPRPTSQIVNPVAETTVESKSCITSSPGKATVPVFNETYMNQSQIISEIELPKVPKKDIISTSPEKKYSPTKALQSFLCDGSSSMNTGGVSLSTLAAVKRSPTVAPSIAGRMIAKGPAAIDIDTIDSEIINLSSHIQDNISTVKIESPSKRCLRISISCDNYLGEGKNVSISTRARKEDETSDNNSPYHSCKGSPLRWAAKADELASAAAGSGSNTMTSSLIVNPTMANILNSTEECRGNMSSSVTSPRIQGPLQKVTSHQRSCSTNHLDLIVDILGVPSDLLTQRDLNKRLFLLEDEKLINKKQKSGTKKTQRSKNMSITQSPNLKICGKSKSCEDEGPLIDTPPVVIRRRSTKRAEVEAKRRSVYLNECKGRSHEQQTCENCTDTAYKVNDLELNKEMFHVPASKSVISKENYEMDFAMGLTTDELEEDHENLIETLVKSKKNVGYHQSTHNECIPHVNIIEEHDEIKVTTEEDSGDTSDYFKSEDNEKLIRIKIPKRDRKFDSVRTLLEKARLKLLKLTGHQKNHRKIDEEMHPSVVKERLNKGDCQSGKDKGNWPDQHKESPYADSCSQSNPVTPSEVRRKCPKNRNRSFSPVRLVYLIFEVHSLML